MVHLRFGNLRRRDFHAALARLWPSVEALLPEHKLINVHLDRVEAIRGWPCKSAMPDIFTPAKRGAMMAAIRWKGNKATELRIIALMRAHGIFGWRRLSIVAIGYRHPDCIFAYTPKSRLDFWLPKFERNVGRGLEPGRNEGGGLR